MIRILTLIGYAALLLIVSGAVAGWWLHQPLPTGVAGGEADAMARAMMSAVDCEAWDSTGYVEWEYGGRRSHRWDRERHFATVNWSDVEVFIDLADRTGVALRKGERVAAPESGELIADAWRIWINDAFWLNPIAKLFDEGTSRALVDLQDGRTGLLVTHDSGGATPGDSYLWLCDQQQVPTEWRMWVSILPVGGISATWERWSTLKTGARISTLHQVAFLDLQINSLRAAHRIDSLYQADPFEILDNPRDIIAEQ